MPYATQSDLASRLAPELLVLLADDNADGQADITILNDVLDAASAEIDQSLGGRYETPLNPAPPIASRWCVDLAVARLFLRRREALPKEHTDAAALTRRAIEMIAAGATGLAGATPRAESLEAQNTKTEDDLVFNEEELSLF